MSAREHDVVVFGATGFVGRLVVEYLAEHAPDDVRVALAGRSRDKLERVRRALPARAARWPLIEADSSDEAAMRALAESTTAVATTVGPYRRYGMPLVGACAVAGTHYADLTGEVLFMRESIDRFDAAARASGARIVHTCGFDSIPSDLGTFALARLAGEIGAGGLEDVTLIVEAMRGGISGGTLASLAGQLDEAHGDPKQRAVVGDPYALSPDRHAEPDLGDERDLRSVTRDGVSGAWVAPFAMASINTRVVRRSNALQGFAYGRSMRYREAMGVGRGPLAPAIGAAVAAGTGAFAAGMAFGPTRTVLDRVLPSPGEGPSEKTRRKGFFTIAIHGRTADGRRLVSRVAAQGDPGYGATAVMLGEAALSLARDGDALPDRAGVLTPATAMGEPLVDRLRAAGQTFTAGPAEA